MQIRTKKLLALLCGIALLLAPIAFTGAETSDMLYIIGSNRDGDRLKIVMNVVMTDTPDSTDVFASFNGLGIDAFQFYPYENFQPGASFCIVPDVASASDGRAMQDMRTIVNTLLDNMAEGDNACIITAGENALSSNRDALKNQLQSLPATRENRYDLLNAALDLLASDASANMRAQIIVLSDGVSKGSVSKELKKRVEESRIPVCSVAMLYGITNPGRIAEIEDLASVVKESHGGVACDAGIQKDTLTAVADCIHDAIGSCYVLELDAASVKKYVDPLGGVCKIGITVGDSTIFDTITLAPEDILLGENNPIGEYTLPTPEPEIAAEPSEPNAPQDTSTPPADTASPPVDTASPTSMPVLTDPPAETGTVASPAHTDTSVQEALSPEKADVWKLYRGLALIWKILIPAGVVFVIAGIIVLLALLRHRRRRRQSDIPNNSVSLGTMVSMPPEAMHTTSGAVDTVHLRIIRLPSDAENAHYTLTMRNSLTIGSDPTVSQLIIDDDAQVLPADSRLETREGKLYVYDLSKENDVGTAVINGGVVRVGKFSYCIYWNM